MLERAGIADLADQKVGKCSGGEQQRLKFAISLLTEPDVLILDEPTAGMDVTSRRAFWNTMHREASAGRTILFATHYLEEAEAFAQRIVLLSQGEIIADGTVEEIRSITAIRHLTAQVPDGAWREAFAVAFPGLGFDLSGSRIRIATPDSDRVAHYLLSHGFSGLEITAPSLDDAFVELTNGAATPANPEKPAAAANPATRAHHTPSSPTDTAGVVAHRE
nr:ABC transporter ATP-binding protein [Actinobaculum suis]